MADPVVTITNGIPVSGTGTITTLGQTLLDGANVTQGSTSDAAASAGGAGSHSAKLRAISRDIAAGVSLQASSAVIGHVVVDSAPSTAVTNAGTFAVQAAATLNAETTKVIGVTRTADGSGNLITSTSNAIDVNIKSGASSGAVAQGSTTSGQTGSLIQGAVTTAAPSYTTAQTSPLSLDTTGALRVNVTAGGAGGGIVTQATAANLNATVVGNGTFAVQAAATLAAETTKVIGVTRTADGSGNLLTATSNALDVNIKSGALLAGSALIGKVGIDQTTDGTTNKVRAILHDGTTAALVKAASTGAAAASDPAVVVTIRDVNANGRAAAASSAPVALSTEDNTLLTRLLPTATASGITPSRVNAAASTNATSLKASAGQIYEIDLFNTAAYNVFLKLYNKASAPTVGTDTPVFTIPIQAGGGYARSFFEGRSFSTGIAYAITKLQADSDTTVVVAGDLTGSIGWI